MKVTPTVLDPAGGIQVNALRTMTQRLLAAFTAIVALALAAAPAGAQYPGKPVRLVVPFPASGAADTIMRIIAPPLE